MQIPLGGYRRLGNASYQRRSELPFDSRIGIRVPRRNSRQLASQQRLQSQEQICGLKDVGCVDHFDQALHLARSARQLALADAL